MLKMTTNVFVAFLLLATILLDFSIGTAADEEEDDHQQMETTTSSADDQQMEPTTKTAKGGIWEKYTQQWESIPTVASDRPFKFADGSCAHENDAGQYVEPEDPLDFKCLADFVNYVMKPECGNPYYDMIKECTKQVTYAGKPFEQSKLAIGDAHEQMVGFALLDGCFKCKLAPGESVKVNVKVTYLWPAGSFFSTCSKKTPIAFDMDYTLPLKLHEQPSWPISQATTMVMRFKARRCDSVFSVDDPVDKFEQIQMVVEHNCGTEDGKMESFTLALPDFMPKDYVGHMAEMKYVQFDLAKGPDGVEMLDERANSMGSNLAWANQK